MANTDAKTPAVTEATAAPKTRGRQATRDPEGKSISGYFSKAEFEKIAKARFKGEHDQLNDLVRTAVNEYADRLLSE